MIKRSANDVKPGVAYLVAFGANPAERFRAVAYPSRAAAIVAAADQRVVPTGECGFVIESEDDVTLNGAALLMTYNELTGESVKRFETRRAGVARLLAALARVALPAVGQPKLEEKREVAKSERANNGKGRAFKAPKVGEFKAIRAGTKLAKNLEVILKGGHTVDSLTRALKCERKDVSFLLRRSLADLHGIGHTINDDGVVTIVVPHGKIASDLIKATGA